MRNILVALDGLSGSEKALVAAVKLAQREGGQLTAVAVLPRASDPHLQQLAGKRDAAMRRRLEDVLQAAVNFARSRGVALSPLLREGHVAEVILACAEEHKIDLLVLGKHNGEGRHGGLGRTADQVSGHAPCTVMIVK
jgi:nucleotide-binding universal stress UspA family protein